MISTSLGNLAISITVGAGVGIAQGTGEYIVDEAVAGWEGLTEFIEEHPACP
jgi:hypothetical protein